MRLISCSWLIFFNLMCDWDAWNWHIWHLEVAICSLVYVTWYKIYCFMCCFSFLLFLPFFKFIYFPFSIMLFLEWKAGMARTGMFLVRANPKEKVKQNWQLWSLSLYAANANDLYACHAWPFQGIITFNFQIF